MYTKLNTVAHTIIPSWLYSRLIGNWDKDGFKRYFLNTSWALTARIVGFIVSFFVMIYLTRYLGPTNLGQLNYAISFVGIFSIIASLGVDFVLYRNLITHPERRNEYLGSALGIKLVAGVFTAILTVSTALLIGVDDVSRTIIFMLAGTYIFNAFNIIVPEFQAQVAQRYPAIVSLIVVFALNTLKVLVILFEKGILYIGIILLLEVVLTTLLLIVIRTKYYGTLSAWRFEKKTALELIKDSWPFIFIAMFASLYNRIDQVMLKHLLDEQAVGLYSAGVRIAETWLVIPSIIASSLFPAIINARKTNLLEYKKRLLSLIGILGGLACIIAIPATIFATPLITFIYGDAFLASIPVFIIYLWSAVWVIIEMVTGQFLLAENKRSLIFTVTSGTALLNILLNFILIPHYGIIGAAWATFISYAILSLPLILILRLKTQSHVESSEKISP